MSGLKTTDIDRILMQYSLFKGTYPCDSVPITTKFEDQAFIINTGNSQSSGQHWVGLIIKQEKCWYFDSFGIELLSLDVLKRLKKAGVENYFSNSKQIQSVNSVSCGYYCIAFILSFVLGNKYEDFLAEFSNNLIKNEKTCHDLIKIYLNSTSQIFHDL